MTREDERERLLGVVLATARIMADAARPPDVPDVGAWEEGFDVCQAELAGALARYEAFLSQPAPATEAGLVEAAEEALAFLDERTPPDLPLPQVAQRLDAALQPYRAGATP